MTSETSLPPARPHFNWHLLGILLLAILVSTILVTPYALAIQNPANHGGTLPLPLQVLIPIQLIATTIIYGTFAALGLLIARRLGLGLPLVDSWLGGRPDWSPARRFFFKAIVAGILVAVAVIALEKLLFAAQIAAELKQLKTPPGHPPVWAGFLASFYGGTTEEILLRLFALSLFAWLLQIVSGSTRRTPSSPVLWTANILAAILFGLGHLPAAAALGLHIDAMLVTRAIVLNGAGGLVFGWFYFTQGLEAAMLCHFSADIVLHVIWPLFGG
ncbi:MAG TPA: CPBP family intramembrane glutamic endopeptidase [Tepidisphaeraceae bacterium]|nr:CPBP family intramembrane glutamic endopeptidase [Tepidisphaeraceae bacterium]